MIFASCRMVSALTALTLTLASLQAVAEPMPDLLPLQPADFPSGCGCSFGVKKGEALVFWSWEFDKKVAALRAPNGLRKLVLRSEQYLPAKNEPPRAGDKMMLQLAEGDWSIQTINTVARTCAARHGTKAKACEGTDYLTRFIVQWRGTQRKDLTGWGHCGCN